MKKIVFLPLLFILYADLNLCSYNKAQEDSINSKAQTDIQMPLTMKQAVFEAIKTKEDAIDLTQVKIKIADEILKDNFDIDGYLKQHMPAILTQVKTESIDLLRAKKAFIQKPILPKIAKLRLTIGKDYHRCFDLTPSKIAHDIDSPTPQGYASHFCNDDIVSYKLFYRK
jgi:hypothetical protein